jgi:hypothetical protein
MDKVYIMNDMDHNYTSAEQFGELVCVSTGILPVFKIDKMLSTIHEQLINFKETDYIVITGPTIFNMLVLPYLFHFCSKVNILIYDAKNQKYVVRTVSRQQIELKALGGELIG